MYNSGHLRVCYVKKNSMQMGQISGLNNNTAQRTKLLKG